MMMVSQKMIADIEAEAGDIEVAEKELASFTKDLSLFARISMPSRRVVFAPAYLKWFSGKC